MTDQAMTNTPPRSYSELRARITRLTNLPEQMTDKIMRAMIDPAGGDLVLIANRPSAAMARNMLASYEGRRPEDGWVNKIPGLKKGWAAMAASSPLNPMDRQHQKLQMALVNHVSKQAQMPAASVFNVLSAIFRCGASVLPSQTTGPAAAKGFLAHYHSEGGQPQRHEIADRVQAFDRAWQNTGMLSPLSVPSAVQPQAPRPGARPARPQLRVV